MILKKTNMGISKLLDHAAKTWPNNMAIRYQDEIITYQDLQTQVNNLAQSLQAQGLKKGDVLAIYLLSNPQFAILYLACFKIGIIVMPLSFRLNNETLSYLIDYAKPKFIISQTDLITNLIKANPKHQNWQLCSLESESSSTRPCLHWQGLIDQGKNLNKPFPPINDEDTATYFSTSGTSGAPKLVIHQHKHFLYNAEYHAKLLKYTEHDTTLAPLAICFNLPFGHQFMAALYTGACLELMPTFEPKQVLERIKSKQVSLLYMVTAMYNEVIKLIPANEQINHNLRACLIAGEAVPTALHQRFHQIFNLYLSEGIGMSEALFYAINIKQNYKLGSQGSEVTGAEIKIKEDGGENPKELGPKQMGEIWIKSHTITKGYLDNPEQTKKSLIDGWLRTGDLGQLDDENYLWFRGRISQLISRDQYKISPTEIEAALYQNPDVLEAGIVGVNNKKGDQDIIAFVVSKARPEELLNFIKPKLETYKLPQNIVILEKLPKGISNKIDRQQLQTMANQQFGAQ